jgi:hypothetical protein
MNRIFYHLNLELQHIFVVNGGYPPAVGDQVQYWPKPAQSPEDKAMYYRVLAVRNEVIQQVNGMTTSNFRVLLQPE